MKKIIVISVLLFVLAACGGEDSTPTAVSPTEAAPTESGSYLDSLEHIPDENLININWQWERRESGGKTIITIPNPADYLLYFKEDGTFSAKMECNNGSGSYASSPLGGTQNNIDMELGPMTIAACGEGSYSTEMSQMFGPAQVYEFAEEGAVLKFIWVAGGPIDYFKVSP